MAVIVHHRDIPDVPAHDGVAYAPVITPEAIGNDRIRLGRVTVAPGATFAIALDAGTIGWMHVLAGGGALAETDLGTERIAYLPLGFSGAFVSGDSESTLLFAEVPDAARFDAALADMPTELRTVEWTREPVLESEHDARTRVYMATPALAGTNAFKGEMISYPPGTAAPEHHHVGAEHFQYVIAGRGTALLDGIPHPLEAGDLLYNYEHETHAFINESDADFTFVEFFVPGPCETVWSPGANVCAWLPTGVDSEGREPSREIGYHVHGQDDGL
ncbi:MAG: cupin domain-containing protein [Alphaproteobacteria bacterium]|nr:cupin domain-containing protein [Alphaproteobacteria bacterium]